MNETIAGAPKPMAAPKIASVRCWRAFAEPATNDRPAKTRPRIAASGRIVPINRPWTAERVDSTLANPTAGHSKAIATVVAKSCFLLFTNYPFQNEGMCLNLCVTTLGQLADGNRLRYICDRRTGK